MKPAAKPPVTYRLIDKDDHDSIRWALAELRLCEANCQIDAVSRAGEGNMNVVLRVRANGQSLILKQSRPWVEKYPSIAAPEDRLLAEIDFYGRVASQSCNPGTSHDKTPVSQWMPRTLAHSVAHRLLALEDLGAASDYTTLYNNTQDYETTERVFADAIEWLAWIHRSPIGDATAQEIGCDELRRLNHDHMFTIPLMDPAAFPLDDLCAGLAQASLEIRTNKSVRSAMSRLGDIYLSGRSEPSQVRRLLHGDFYPGSWLRTDSGFRVIDPEFCFAGPVEFDLGILSAHRILCQTAAPDDTAGRMCHQYQQCGGPAVTQSLVEGFAGAEIIRRLVGVAQLPIKADLAVRRRWLSQGRELIAHA